MLREESRDDRHGAKDEKSVCITVEVLRPGAEPVSLSHVAQQFNGDINPVNRSVAFNDGKVILHRDGLLVVTEPSVTAARDSAVKQHASKAEFLRGAAPANPNLLRIRSVSIRYRIPQTRFSLSTVHATAPTIAGVASAHYVPSVAPCVVLQILAPPTHRVVVGRFGARAAGAAAAAHEDSLFRRSAPDVPTAAQVHARVLIFASGDIVATGISDPAAEHARSVAATTVSRAAMLDAIASSVLPPICPKCVSDVAWRSRTRVDPAPPKPPAPLLQLQHQQQPATVAPPVVVVPPAPQSCRAHWTGDPFALARPQLVIFTVSPHTARRPKPPPAPAAGAPPDPATAGTDPAAAAADPPRQTFEPNDVVAGLGMPAARRDGGPSAFLERTAPITKDERAASEVARDRWNCDPRTWWLEVPMDRPELSDALTLILGGVPLPCAVTILPPNSSSLEREIAAAADVGRPTPPESPVAPTMGGGKAAAAAWRVATPPYSHHPSAYDAVGTRAYGSGSVPRVAMRQAHHGVICAAHLPYLYKRPSAAADADARSDLGSDGDDPNMGDDGDDVEREGDDAEDGDAAAAEGEDEATPAPLPPPHVAPTAPVGLGVPVAPHPQDPSATASLALSPQPPPAPTGGKAPVAPVRRGSSVGGKSQGSDTPTESEGDDRPPSSATQQLYGFLGTQASQPAVAQKAPAVAQKGKAPVTAKAQKGPVVAQKGPAAAAPGKRPMPSGGASPPPGKRPAL